MIKVNTDRIVRMKNELEQSLKFAQEAFNTTAKELDPTGAPDFQKLDRQREAIRELKVELHEATYCNRILEAEIEGSKPEERVAGYIMDQLLLGADDTWSGRGNDARRTEFDTKRAFYKRIVTTY